VSHGVQSTVHQLIDDHGGVVHDERVLDREDEQLFGDGTDEQIVWMRGQMVDQEAQGSRAVAGEQTTRGHILGLSTSRAPDPAVVAHRNPTRRQPCNRHAPWVSANSQAIRKSLADRESAISVWASIGMSCGWAPGQATST